MWLTIGLLALLAIPGVWLVTLAVRLRRAR